MEPVIQIPDTSKGQSAMVLVKGVWFALYYKDGKVLRRSLRTDNRKDAIKFRDQFFSDLLADGSTIYTGRKAQQKVLDKPNLYIYERPPYQFKVKGKVLCESWDRSEVEKARDEYISENAIDDESPPREKP
jgi:hypothetical protein